jgi:hypothetical protein
MIEGNENFIFDAERRGSIPLSEKLLTRTYALGCFCGAGGPTKTTKHM